MKQLTLILMACVTAFAAASAQTRTYGDLDSKTFVIGLDSYYFGDSGSMSFQCSGRAFQAEIAGGRAGVRCGEIVQVLAPDARPGDTLVGIHDFTGDNEPELVVARRESGCVRADVYTWSDGAWKRLGTVGARGSGISEIRVFRQALTIKDHESGALHTWTCHGGRFDFKSSGGGPDPTLAL